MSLTKEIADALAFAVTPISPEFDLQIVTRREFKPTPPCIDIFPTGPFVEDAGFGRESVRMRFTVRTRVGGNDPDGQTELLYEFMDPFGPLSVRGALLDDATLGGLADVQLLDQSGMQAYQDVADAPVLPGFEITIGVFNREGVVS